MTDFERAITLPTLDEQLMSVFSPETELDERIFQPEFLPDVITIHANARYPDYVLGKVRYKNGIVGVFSYKKQSNSEYAKASFYDEGACISTLCVLKGTSEKRQETMLIAKEEEMNRIKIYLGSLQLLQWRPHFEAAKQNQLLYVIKGRDSYLTTFLDGGITRAGKLLYEAVIMGDNQEIGNQPLIPLAIDWDKYDIEQRMPWEGGLKHTVLSVSYSSSVKEEIVRKTTKKFL